MDDPDPRRATDATVPALRVRRPRIGLLLPLLLIGGWYGGKALVRAHVDSLIAATAGERLPTFELRDGRGETWTAERLGGRPAVLHFFRSRCEACEAEAAGYRRFEAAVADRAQVLHVVTDAVLEYPAAETAATIARKGYAAPVLVADAAFVDAFHRTTWANVTPVTYMASADGRVRAALRGAQTFEQLQQAFAAVE